MSMFFLSLSTNTSGKHEKETQCRGLMPAARKYELFKSLSLQFRGKNNVLKACATKMVEKGWKEIAVREIVRVVLELGHPHSDKDGVGYTIKFNFNTFNPIRSTCSGYFINLPIFFS